MLTRRTRSLAAAFVLTALAVTLASHLLRPGDLDWSAAHTAPSAQGSLEAGFHAPGLANYYSGQVVEPEKDTWSRVRPSSTYRVLLLADGKDDRTASDPQVGILVAAVRKWAATEDRVALKVRYLSDATRFIQDIDDAATTDHADLIITAGNDLVEPLAVVSANHAGYHPQQFLVLGAELAEPTANVAASDWKGSAYLGEGLDQALYYDPSAVTVPRASAALTAGVAAVLAGYRSVIVRIPADQYE